MTETLSFTDSQASRRVFAAVRPGLGLPLTSLTVSDRAVQLLVTHHSTVLDLTLALGASVVATIIRLLWEKRGETAAEQEMGYTQGWRGRPGSCSSELESDGVFDSGPLSYIFHLPNSG